MTSPESTIAQTLFQHFAALNLDDPVAWPNTPFSPLQGQAHYRIAVLPAQTQARALRSGANHLPGILQVTVYCPAGVGEIEPRMRAAQIIKHFQRGTRLQGPPRIDIIHQPYIGPPQQSTDWYSMPVSIPYQATT